MMKNKKSQSSDKVKDADKEDDTLTYFPENMNFLSLEMIPQQYILRHWTKNLIPTALSNKRNTYGEKNVTVENFSNEATSILDHYVEADCPNPPSKNKADNLEQLVGVTKTPVIDVNNPYVRMPKGRRKLRIKGGKEKVIEKSLKLEQVMVQKEIVVQDKEDLVQEKEDLVQDEEDLVQEAEELV
ncbi:hypothetical protein Tco_1383331 [Tanacetum coccineum]